MRRFLLVVIEFFPFIYCSRCREKTQHFRDDDQVTCCQCWKVTKDPPPNPEGE